MGCSMQSFHRLSLSWRVMERFRVSYCILVVLLAGSMPLYAEIPAKMSPKTRQQILSAFYAERRRTEAVNGIVGTSLQARRSSRNHQYCDQGRLHSLRNQRRPSAQEVVSAHSDRRYGFDHGYSRIRRECQCARLVCGALL